MSAMPQQRPGQSEQAVGTPRELIAAIERRFGPIIWDLAATIENRVVQFYLGPDTIFANSLAVDWAAMSGLLWLNPPYEDIAPWARKAAIEGSLGARIAMLVPASIGSNWFRDDVQGQALVVPIAPRVTFVGHTKPYPKDLILCLYGPWVSPGFAPQWRWKMPVRKRCRTCGSMPQDVLSADQKVIAQQCPLCLAYAPTGQPVGREVAKKKAPTRMEAQALRAAKEVLAQRQLGLFGK